jgi:hypothetical protein
LDMETSRARVTSENIMLYTNKINLVHRKHKESNELP